jgi:hypothetical protein
MQQVLNVVSEMLLRYAKADISKELTETDVMYAGSMVHTWRWAAPQLR